MSSKDHDSSLSASLRSEVCDGVLVKWRCCLWWWWQSCGGGDDAVVVPAALPVAKTRFAQLQRTMAELESARALLSERAKQLETKEQEARERGEAAHVRGKSACAAVAAVGCGRLTWDGVGVGAGAAQCLRTQCRS